MKICPNLLKLNQTHPVQTHWKIVLEKVQKKFRRKFHKKFWKKANDPGGNLV